MEIGAIEREISRGAEVGAQEIGVGDNACEDYSHRGSTGETREGGALESERGKGVGEGIHRGEVIS